MVTYVLDFQEIGQSQVALVGGKGAHLGELSRIEGIRVPAGFCVTTAAFERIMTLAPSIEDRLTQLHCLKLDDRDAIRARSAEIRRMLEEISIPDDLAAAITGRLFNWTITPRTRSGPARQQKICRPPHSLASMTVTSTLSARQRSFANSASAGPRSSPSGR